MLIRLPKACQHNSPTAQGGALAEKRARRNPFSQEHDYRQCPGLQSFFAFIDEAANGESTFVGILPWQDSPDQGRAKPCLTHSPFHLIVLYWQK